MDRGKSNQPPTGKAYIQRLKSGPVANITLPPAKAGIRNIRRIPRTDEHSWNRTIWRRTTSGTPLLVPRNILWLSTMKDRWLSDPSDYYRTDLSQPSYGPIFGQPEIIKALITDVKTNNDTQGYALSDQDIKPGNQRSTALRHWMTQTGPRNSKCPCTWFLLIKAWQCR